MARIGQTMTPAPLSLCRQFAHGTNPTPQVNRNSTLLLGKQCAKPKTTTCFDVNFKGSKARDCFVYAPCIPCWRLECMTPRHGLSHLLLSHKKSHGCSYVL